MNPFDCPLCGEGITPRSGTIWDCPHHGGFQLDHDGNIEWLEDNRAKCPECGWLMQSTHGGQTTLSGYKIVYRKCPNPDCFNYQTRMSVRQFPDGREQVQPVAVLDAAAARRRLVGDLFSDIKAFGGISDDTLVLAQQIREAK